MKQGHTRLSVSCDSQDGLTTKELEYLYVFTVLLRLCQAIG